LDVVALPVAVLAGGALVGELTGAAGVTVAGVTTVRSLGLV
jgi:hypothetical protein